MKPWTGDRNNTKNRGIFLRMHPDSLCLLRRQKERERQAFLSQFPQINSVQMKSGNINRPENLGCAPLALKMCLSSLKQYLVRERADSTWSESASSTGNGAQMVVEGFLFLSFIIFISGQFLPPIGLPTVQTTRYILTFLSRKTKKSNKSSCLRRVWLFFFFFCFKMSHINVIQWTHFSSSVLIPSRF